MSSHLPGFEEQFAIALGQNAQAASDHEVEPMSNWILCRLVKEEARRGVFVPQGAEVPERSYFVAVKCGPGFVGEHGVLMPMTIAPGDRFLLEGGSPVHWTEHQGEKLGLVRLIWVCSKLTARSALVAG